MREGHEPVRPVPPRGEGAVSAVGGRRGGYGVAPGEGRSGGARSAERARIESNRIESLEGCPNTQHMHKRFRDEQVVDVD